MASQPSGHRLLTAGLQACGSQSLGRSRALVSSGHGSTYEPTAAVVACKRLAWNQGSQHSSLEGGGITSFTPSSGAVDTIPRWGAIYGWWLSGRESQFSLRICSFWWVNAPGDGSTLMSIWTQWFFFFLKERESWRRDGGEEWMWEELVEEWEYFQIHCMLVWNSQKSN